MGPSRKGVRREHLFSDVSRHHSEPSRLVYLLKASRSALEEMRLRVNEMKMWSQHFMAAEDASALSRWQDHCGSPRATSSRRFPGNLFAQSADNPLIDLHP